MAQCANCGTKVGCGCQLKNGLCATCAAKNSVEITQVEEHPLEKFIYI